jgi:hypothetical protein
MNKVMILVIVIHLRCLLVDWSSQAIVGYGPMVGDQLLGDGWRTIEGFVFFFVYLLVLCSFAIPSFTSAIQVRLCQTVTLRVVHQVTRRITMSSETMTCSGCDGTFSLRGYHSHLAQTRDPLCLAVLDKLKKVEVEAVTFQGAGDAFETAEDYVAMDPFGQSGDESDDAAHSGPDNSGPTALSEVSDDEEENEEMAHMVAELERGWEPHREGAPHLEAEDNNDGSGNVEVRPNSEANASDSDDEGDDRQRNIGRFIIGDGYGVKPTVRIRYTDKYPNSRAGQPLSHEESRDSGYTSALGGGDNPWAPFNSKKDWEIARWAKLREIGSTAFSELLATEGVCYN